MNVWGFTFYDSPTNLEENHALSEIYFYLNSFMENRTILLTFFKRRGDKLGGMSAFVCV
jgi:hypothetical protein